MKTFDEAVETVLQNSPMTGKNMEDVREKYKEFCNRYSFLSDLVENKKLSDEMYNSAMAHVQTVMMNPHTECLNLVQGLELMWIHVGIAIGMEMEKGE